MPVELLKIFPAAFSDLLFEFFDAGVRIKCVMKEWGVSTLIPIYKRKGRIAVAVNHRPLRLIFILRKTFR